MAETVRDIQRRLRANFAKKHVEYPRRVLMLWKQAMRQRVDRTKALIEFRGYRGDFHMHSNHSDGSSTVADLFHYKEASGLDTIFVTDHMGVTQKRDCVRYPNVWWGQEPGTQHHHLGILGLDRRFGVSSNLVSDYRGVIDKGGVPFIAHPTGWFPDMRYKPEQIDALELLGDEFAMEIINGANQVYDCWDVTDEMSVELWDRHLVRGKRIVALGNTDAHLCEAIGDLWNGLFAEELSKEGILDAIRRGRLFVSDGPLVDLTAEVDGGPIVRMGETVRVSVSRTAGKAITVRVLAADSAGLGVVRLIRDGKPVRTWRTEADRPRDGQVVSQALTDPDGGRAVYYRLECRSLDGRRAFTNPIYVR